MSFSLARLTLYGAISNIDIDLRELAKTVLLEAQSDSGILPPELHAKLTSRAERDDGYAGELLDYMDLPDSLEFLSKYKTALQPRAQSFLKQHGSNFNGLVPVRNRVMHARPLQFTDLSMVETLLRAISTSPLGIFKNTKLYSELLRHDPYYPFSLDVSALHSHKDTVQHNLPIPDFDETGFLGRTDETTKLLKACKGPWPLITVVGEGGFGKTALALQVAYELLDDPDQPFECVVWATSKTTRLSLNEIEQIDGAITTSLGLLTSIHTTLAGATSSADILNEIAEYLREFRILLIIDNLETVLDQTMIDFFSRLTGKSKILVTSRVGTGAMNYPFPIGALSESDSLQLLRATARARRVAPLLATKAETLRGYCRRMKFNPGFIKWFVSVVQCGKRPDEALVNPSVFLDFCMSNIYEYVSDDAKNVAMAMLAVPGKHTQPSLSYISGLEGDRFQSALQSLWSANMASMANIETETGHETIYELNELPRLYIMRHHPPAPSDVSQYQLKKRQIILMHEKLQVQQRGDKFDHRYISRRTTDDTVIAKYLSDALAASGRGEREAALELVERCKRLDPGYFEVHRVEAMLHHWNHNPTAALESYETALACEPGSGQLRYWFGGFLLRGRDDLVAAQKQFEAALALEPGVPQVLLELGRVHLFSGRYEMADLAFEPAVKSEGLTIKARRKALDSWLQSALRRFQKGYDDGDFEQALSALESLVSRYSENAASLGDEKIIETVWKALPTARSLVGALSQTDMSTRAMRCLVDIQAVHLTSSLPAPPIDGAPNQEEVGKAFIGYIDRYDPARKYGFIRYNDAQRIFFHLSAVKDVVILSVYVGARVEFVVVMDGDKFKADEIRMTGDEKSRMEVDDADTRVGIVKVFLPDKRYGFIFDDADGGEVFFHANNLIENVAHRIVAGSRVRYRLGKNPKGTAAIDISVE